MQPAAGSEGFGGIVMNDLNDSAIRLNYNHGVGKILKRGLQNAALTYIISSVEILLE